MTFETKPSKPFTRRDMRLIGGTAAIFIVSIVGLGIATSTDHQETSSVNGDELYKALVQVHNDLLQTQQLLLEAKEDPIGKCHEQ